MKFYPRNDIVLVKCWCMLVINVSYFIPKTLVQSSILQVFGDDRTHNSSFTDQFLHSSFQNSYSHRLLRFRLLDCMEGDRVIKSFYFKVFFCVDVVFVANFSWKSISSPILKEDLTGFVRGGAVFIEMCPDASTDFL